MTYYEERLRLTGEHTGRYGGGYSLGRIPSGICRDAPGHFVAYLCGLEEVYAWKVEGERLDIGTPASYREADRLLRAPHPPSP